MRELAQPGIAVFGRNESGTLSVFILEFDQMTFLFDKLPSPGEAGEIR